MVLLAVKNHDPAEDLRLISDSKYVIDRLTKNLKRWEQRGWIDITNGNLFKSIIAWIRWRRARTFMRWTRGHSGTLGNKEVDRLASEGAMGPQPQENTRLTYPQGETKPGAILKKME